MKFKYTLCYMRSGPPMPSTALCIYAQSGSAAFSFKHAALPFANLESHGKSKSRGHIISP
jgi:hypothetical protein